jgi:Flp pilus assembly protein CpaB
MPAHLLSALTRPLQRLPRRLRIALTTRPLAYWSLTGLVAAVVGYAVFGVVTAAEATRAGYGSTTPVVVATRGVEPGTPLDASNTTVRELPAALVPDGALAALDTGATAATALVAGEVVNTTRVGRGGDGPVSALLPDGTRGLAVPVDEGSLPLRPGDRVDLVAAVTAGLGGTARVVATGAPVAHVGERVVVVAVPTVQLPDVAQALADGRVILALSAGP